MDKIEAAKALYRSRFSSFLRFAFNELYPDRDLLDNWHIDLMADNLVACARGDIRRLIINVPPRYLKSFCTSIAWPAYLLGREPTLKIMLVAGTRDLAVDLTESIARLMSSSRYRELFPSSRLSPEKRGLNLLAGGMVISTAFGATVIGRGADIMIIDDPTPPVAARNPANLQSAKAWYDAELFPRLNSKRHGIMVVAQQRVHIDDLSGYLLKNAEWRHLSIPVLALKDEERHFPSGRVHRRAKGAVLFEKLESREELIERYRTIGDFNFRSQYLQMPPERFTKCECGFFYHPLDYANWTDDQPWPSSFIGNVPLEVFGLKELFDIGEPPLRPTEWQPSDEQWERATLRQQRQLLQQCGT